MDQVDGDYLGSYRRFIVDFVESMNPDDQLPVKMTGHDVREAEVVGEVIDMTLQYLNQKYCPPSLQSHIVHLVIEEIKKMCRTQPEACGLRPLEKTYAPLKLMQAVTGKVNEICQRYLENSRLALLPPPPSTPLPLATVYAIRNSRRKMEDRHVILHDLNTIFNIQEESTASYYAVFDGHIGTEAAVYCAAHLHQYLVESVHYPTDPERALRDAFITTDAYFVQNSQDYRINSGATAVCALIINRKLYVAWAGDSQAALAKRGNVTQLVNPHRPDRVDEKERVIRMGGSVIYFGTWRVNGHLAVSRAIGDAQYKPYVTGDPEIRCVMLDGTEDFLIIACDGLWDHIDETTAAGIVYQQICHDPHNLEAVSQRLVEYSKNKGSSDNITVIVVFLTPPNQIATRFTHNHPLIADVELNNMEPDNRYFSSVTGQFDNSNFGKQLNNGTGTGFDEDEMVFGKSSNSANGRHENGAVEYEEEEEEDDDDLGPESNVDAVDEAGDVCGLANVSRELFPDKSPTDEVTEDKEVAEGVRNAGSKQNEHVDADNVGDSEDSDDEWNYYRVDPDKEKREETEKIEKIEVSGVPEVTGEIDQKIPVEELEIGESEKEREREVEEKEKEVDSSSDSEVVSGDQVEIRLQITDTEILETPSSVEPPQEPSSPHLTPEEMDFQLNPNAAEFIPVSPAPSLPTRIMDLPISGSPLKSTPMMDDIRVPSPSEFQEEISHRPSEIDEKITCPQNGDHEEEITDDINSKITSENQKYGFNPDESEVSSTRAEFGDESTSSFLHKTPGFDGSFTSTCSAFDDPMMMSFGPGDFTPLNSHPVDLNAVHDLTDADLADGNNALQEEELHPELADLISPETDQPKPSEAFPDDQVDEIFGDISDQQMEERIEQVSQEVETMNLKNSQDEFKSNGEESSRVFDDKNENIVIPETPESIEHVQESQEHVQEAPDHIQESQEHVQESREHVQESQDHIQESQDYVQESPDHVQESQEHVQESLDHIQESQEHVQESPDHVQESQEHVQESQEHVQKSQEHAQESLAHVQESLEIVQETFDLMSCEPVCQNPFISSSDTNPFVCSTTEDVSPAVAPVSPLEKEEHIQEIGEGLMDMDPLEEVKSPIAIFPEDKLENLMFKNEEINETKIAIPESSVLIKLSESLQEFTGLEEQFNPLEKDLNPSPGTQAAGEEQNEETKQEDLLKLTGETVELISPVISPEIKSPIQETPAAPVVQKVDEKEKSTQKTKTTKPPVKPPVKTSKLDVKTTLKPSSVSPSKSSPRPGVPPAKKPSPRPLTKSPAPPAGVQATKVTKSVPKTTVPAPRNVPVPPKPKTTTGVSRLTATKVSVTDKKSPVSGVPNGEIKNAITKPKMASKPMLKSSITSSRPATAPAKPKVPSSSGKTCTSAPGTAGTAAGRTQRPKTAPGTSSLSSTGTSTSRTGKNVLPKSPAVDKQIKETANKQISSTRTSSTTSTVKKMTSSTTSAASARRLTSTSTTTTGVKKVAGNSKVTGKSSVMNGKTVPKGIVKGKLQNGVCGGKEKIMEDGKNDKEEVKVEDSKVLEGLNEGESNEEDVPLKDVSPVDVGNDNQMIITAE